MENIVDEIIKIDKKADDRLVQADNQRKEILDNSEKEASDIRATLSANAEKRISQVLNFHKSETDAAIQKISEDCNEKIMQLDKAFEENHKSIEDSILQSIVGGNID